MLETSTFALAFSAGSVPGRFTPDRWNFTSLAFEEGCKKAYGCGFILLRLIGPSVYCIDFFLLVLFWRVITFWGLNFTVIKLILLFSTFLGMFYMPTFFNKQRFLHEIVCIKNQQLLFQNIKIAIKYNYWYSKILCTYFMRARTSVEFHIPYHRGSSFVRRKNSCAARTPCVQNKNKRVIDEMTRGDQ